MYLPHIFSPARTPYLQTYSRIAKARGSPRGAEKWGAISAETDVRIAKIKMAAKEPEIEKFVFIFFSSQKRVDINFLMLLFVY